MMGARKELGSRAAPGSRAGLARAGSEGPRGLKTAHQAGPWAVVACRRLSAVQSFRAH
jgi:hypothetical protein